MTDEAIAVLTELVACKDLKEQVDAFSMPSRALSTDERVSELMRQANIAHEYERRKPLAWAAARAVLAKLKDAT